MAGRVVTGYCIPCPIPDTISPLCIDVDTDTDSGWLFKFTNTNQSVDTFNVNIYKTEPIFSGLWYGNFFLILNCLATEVRYVAIHLNKVTWVSNDMQIYYLLNS